MTSQFQINGRTIGSSTPVYIIAELSANHNQDFDQAVQLLHAAKESGADAVKLQTYLPQTMTIAGTQKHFQVGAGTLWEGRTLYDLYGEAFTPWEWHPKLKQIADEIQIDFFSTAFDASALEFLETLEVPAHKVASFELVDIPLIERMAATGKPLIMSTGMASLAEIDEAVRAARNAGAAQIALLKCTSAYPAPAEEMHLNTIPHLAQSFGVPAGLSDHTLGIAVPAAAVAIGASIVEKHFTLSRSVPGPDSAFSLEPCEFKAMVEAIRTVEKAVGRVHYGTSGEDEKMRAYRRSLFVVKPIKAGEAFTETNVRSIRPGHGLPPKHLSNVLGRQAAVDITEGTPLEWALVG